MIYDNIEQVQIEREELVNERIRLENDTMKAKLELDSSGEVG